MLSWNELLELGFSIDSYTFGSSLMMWQSPPVSHLQVKTEVAAGQPHRPETCTVTQSLGLGKALWRVQCSAATDLKFLLIE